MDFEMIILEILFTVATRKHIVYNVIYLSNNNTKASFIQLPLIILSFVCEIPSILGILLLTQ